MKANSSKYLRLLEALGRGETPKMKVFGNSMMPKIKSASTLTYQKAETYEKGDVVFSKVHGRYIDAHQITQKDGQGRCLISNNLGWDNGWTTQVFGKVIAIEPPR